MLRYNEGDEFEFNVEKHITTPDSVNHFILSGPDNRKFLLPEKEYSQYNICIGKSLVCRVDRINCKGEIFLEPVNPWYTEKRFYYFRVTGTDIRSDSSGNPVKVTLVTDNSANEIAVQLSGKTPLPGSRIKLLVERISKGKLILAREKGSKTGMNLINGKEYKFIVENIARGLDGKDYYVIIDPYGFKHTIAKEYYESYGLNPGSKFTGKVVKYRSNGEMIIEPEHPFYKVGAVLTMRITGKTRNPVNDSYNIDLLDETGHSHCIETDLLPSEESMRCRIIMMRKGKPLLEIL